MKPAVGCYAVTYELMHVVRLLTARGKIFVKQDYIASHACS